MNFAPKSVSAEDSTFKIDSNTVREFQILAPVKSVTNTSDFKSDIVRKMSRLTESYINGFRDNFKCEKDGHYADVSSGCIVFYRCIWTRTSWEKKFKQICPEGTAFNDLYGICDWTYKVKCR